jgi:hypothetical protein
MVGLSDVLHVLLGAATSFLEPYRQIVVAMLFIAYQFSQWLVARDDVHVDFLEYGVGYMVGLAARFLYSIYSSSML